MRINKPVMIALALALQAAAISATEVRENIFGITTQESLATSTEASAEISSEITTDVTSEDHRPQQKDNPSQLRRFVDFNFDQLQRDAAAGRGEYVATLHALARHHEIMPLPLYRHALKIRHDELFSEKYTFLGKLRVVVARYHQDCLSERRTKSPRSRDGCARR